MANNDAKPKQQGVKCGEILYCPVSFHFVNVLVMVYVFGKVVVHTIKSRPWVTNVENPCIKVLLHKHCSHVSILCYNELGLYTCSVDYLSARVSCINVLANPVYIPQCQSELNWNEGKKSAPAPYRCGPQRSWLHTWFGVIVTCLWTLAFTFCGLN